MLRFHFDFDIFLCLILNYLNFEIYSLIFYIFTLPKVPKVSKKVILRNLEFITHIYFEERLNKIARFKIFVVALFLAVLLTFLLNTIHILLKVSFKNPLKL